MSEYPIVRIEAIDPTAPPVVSNLRLLLNGEDISDFVSGFEIKAGVNDVNRITLQIIGNTEIEGLLIQEAAK